jgi:hypothetical protein
MPTSPTDLIAVSDDSWTDFDSFEDAVDQIKQYRQNELDLLNRIGERKKDRALARFWVGEIVAYLQSQAEYGDDIMGQVTDQVGVSKSYLRESRQFYDAHDGSEQACRAWMDQVEKERGQVHWSYCRNWARKQLSGDDWEEDNQKVESETRRLERRAERLEQDARETEEQVIQSNADEEKKAEALGAAARARQVVEETRRRAGELQLDDYERVESDRWREMVTTVDCFACGRAGSREDMNPHHLERSGHATKGPDTETIALCTDCHRKLHGMPEEDFWKSVGVNPWKKLCQRILSPALSTLHLDTLAEELEPYFRTQNQ